MTEDEQRSQAYRDLLPVDWRGLSGTIKREHKDDVETNSVSWVVFDEDRNDVKSRQK